MTQLKKRSLNKGRPSAALPTRSTFVDFPDGKEYPAGIQRSDSAPSVLSDEPLPNRAPSPHPVVSSSHPVLSSPPRQEEIASKLLGGQGR